jgi:hypothetical protein
LRISWHNYFVNGLINAVVATKYAALKLAGLEEAPCQFAVFADRATLLGHGLGRRTMPEMAEYSFCEAFADCRYGPKRD